MWSRNCLPFLSISVHSRFFQWVRVPRSLSFCVMFCRLLFVLFLLVIRLSVLLRFTSSDNLIGIIKPVCPSEQQPPFSLINRYITHITFLASIDTNYVSIINIYVFNHVSIACIQNMSTDLLFRATNSASLTNVYIY